MGLFTGKSMQQVRSAFFSGLMFLSCTPDDHTTTGQSLGYSFGQPERISLLPEILTEISGLQWLKSNQIACIQDEKGIIFVYDVEKNKVIRQIEFGEEGDYESIALAGKHLYVAESNGKLHLIRDFNTDIAKVAARTIETQFSGKNNMEGMCHDSENNRLLLALKDDPGPGPEDHKAVYAMDTETKKVTLKPVYTIDLTELADSLLQDRLSALAFALRKMLYPEKAADLFRPSGIAIHPLTRDIYLIGSENRILVILDKNNRLKHVYGLQSSLFMQPEGITFAENGDLYISNEGRGRQANILKFTYVLKN